MTTELIVHKKSIGTIEVDGVANLPAKYDIFVYKEIKYMVNFRYIDYDTPKFQIHLTPLL